MVPVVPRTVIEEPRWGGLERVPERFVTEMFESEANVIPGSENHDLSQEQWRIRQSYLRWFPPADPAGDRG